MHFCQMSYIKELLATLVYCQNGGNEAPRLSGAIDKKAHTQAHSVFLVLLYKHTANHSNSCSSNVKKRQQQMIKK